LNIFIFGVILILVIVLKCPAKSLWPLSELTLCIALISLKNIGF
jgi:hypothetical protein